MPELQPWIDNYITLVRNLSIPLKSPHEHSQCSMYARNYTDIVRYLEFRTPYQLMQEKVEHMSSRPLPDEKIVKCQQGWHYDTSMYPNTVVTEVC